MELTKFICEQLNQMKPQLLSGTDIQSYEELITFVDDRLGHDKRYAVDDSKIRNQIGWMSRISFGEGLKKTLDWYVHKWEEVVQ
nr:hypothetical protein [Halobacillus amylolyticus]